MTPYVKKAHLAGQFSTNDIQAVAYLLTQGEQVENIKKDSATGRSTFFLVNSEALQRHLDDFYAGRGLIEPKAFLSAYRSIKGEIMGYGSNHRHS